MREDLLTNVKMAATGVNINDIKSLTGSENDLNSSHYQDLKAIMVAERAALPTTRFVYLLGQQDDGTIFFFIDSEPADSIDNSPPGQVYDVPSETIDMAFQGLASTGGPQSDQWGVWMSGMVPIEDPATGKVIAVLGMDISAADWTGRAIEAGLVPALITLLLVTLVTIFFHIQRRKERENQKLSEAADALRESSDKYRTLIENSLDAVFIDQDGKLAFVSPVIQGILGYTPEEILSHPILDFVAPDDRNRVTEFTKAVTEKVGTTQLRRVRLLNRNNLIETLVTLNISKINYQGRPAYMGVLHDLTATEQAEMDLAEANRKLRLLSSITRHDLGNKITAIQGYSVLASGTDNDLQVKEFLSRLRQVCDSAGQLIEFAREYEKIGIAAPHWYSLEILFAHAIAQNNIGTIKAASRVNGVSVYADAMLEKVLYNLVDNSVRHGRTITSLTLEYQLDGDSLVIIYNDDGVGVSQENKEHIFERGFGSNTGMGLFLTREILNITGIMISETGEKGVRFEMRVPYGRYRIDN